jgi:26S proteasome regulatory subunit N6
MASAPTLLADAEKCAKSNPSQAENLYKGVLQSNASSLQDQETALIKLGELYRDQKNADGVAEVITLSRSFMSSTAKAKTAKLSESSYKPSYRTMEPASDP